MLPDAASLPTLTDLLARHSRALVDRTRRWPTSGWRRPAGALGTAADVVHHLVGVLAVAGQLVETGQGPASVAPGRPARAGYDAALSDQLAVVAHDLVTALRAARPGEVAGDVPVERVAARALAETLLHGHACDNRNPGEAAARAVLAELDRPARPPYADALLALGDCVWLS